MLPGLLWRLSLLLVSLFWAIPACFTGGGPSVIPGGGSGAGTGEILQAPSQGAAGPADSGGGAPAAAGGSTTSSGGGGGTTGEEGGAADTSGPASPSGGPGEIADTPIIVVGSPIPISPMDLCRTPCEPHFQDLVTAKTEEASESGFPFTQVRGYLRCRSAEGEMGLGGRSVSVTDPLFPEESRGFTNVHFGGCFFLKVAGPPGRVVRLSASHCLQGVTTEFTIPQETASAALDPCPPPPTQSPPPLKKVGIEKIGIGKPK